MSNGEWSQMSRGSGIFYHVVGSLRCDNAMARGVLGPSTLREERDAWGWWVSGWVALVCTQYSYVSHSILKSKSFFSSCFCLWQDSGWESLLLLPLRYLLIPISCLCPPGHYSSLRFYLSPPGSLLTSQLVFECLCSLNSSLSYTLISYESSCCYLVSKLPLVDHCVLKLLNVTFQPSSPPTYPHGTDQTLYTCLLIVAFHLHAFLLTVLSFWMITFHFCPINFFSSLKM